MNVTCYFDPSCPFSWVTSRFLLRVSDHREVVVTWKPFCLSLKNDETSPRKGESEHAEAHRNSQRILRLMLALEKKYNMPLIDSYTACGTLHHVHGLPLDDTSLKLVLRETFHLSESLISFANDTTHDSVLQQYIAEAMSVMGEEMGVPSIAFERTDGTKRGYFGPVLGELPPLNEALDIWDGLSKLATADSFYELKRDRPSGAPNTASTAACEIA